MTENDDMQIPLDLSKQLRDVSLDKVLKKAGSSFQERARKCISNQWAGKTGTAEDFRMTCIKYGIRPHHPNAWGGFTMGLIRSGLLKKTGEYSKMRAKRSHSRETPIYKVLSDPLTPRQEQNL